MFEDRLNKLEKQNKEILSKLTNVKKIISKNTDDTNKKIKDLVQ